MGNASVGGVAPDIPKAADTSRDTSDQALLECFIARGDEEAFGALVRRHGGTVWGVCRRMLRQEQDAEDAFQAVFLVLARRANSIRKGEAVGSWLYRVAYRTAMRARRSAARRQIREKQAARAAHTQEKPWGDEAYRELQRVLDEEVERLAEKYRAPFVLCALQSMSKAEAARELGWKEGTVSGRLARARRILETRLARRGLTVSAALTAVAVTQKSAAAAPVLLDNTVKGALATVAGDTKVVAPSVLQLARSIGRAMAAERLKRPALLMVFLLILLSTASVTALQLAGVDVSEPDFFMGPPLALGTPIDEQVQTVAFSPDGKHLITAGGKKALPGQVQIWDVATKKNLVTVRPTPGVRSVAYALDGQSFATGDGGGHIKIRDAASGQERAFVHAHGIGVNSIAYAPDGQTLASAGLDGTVKLWDANGLQEKQVFHGHAKMVFSLAYFHRTSAIVSADKDKAIVWDVNTGEERFVLRGHESAITAVAVAPDDKIVATASLDSTIKLWDAQTGKEAAVLRGSDDAVCAIAFSPDGKLMASASSDGTIRLWEVSVKGPATRTESAVLGKHAAAVWALAFSRDGTLLASGSSDQTAKLWHMTTGKETATLTTFSPLVRPILALAYAPDGQVVAMGTTDSAVQIRDAKTGDVLRALTGHTGAVGCLAFSPDGQTLASGSADASVKLWDWTTGQEIRTLLGHAGDVHALIFAADGKTLASSSRDKTIKLWDSATGKERSAFAGHEGAVRALAFAPDGRLVSGSDDRTIRIWDVTGANEPIILQGHTGPVRAVGFGAGVKLASASDDATIKLWDLGERNAVLTLEGHTNAVRALTFTPSGATLISGGMDNTVRVWNPATGALKAMLPGHKQEVTALAMHPRGKHVLSGGHDAVLFRWQGRRVASAAPKVPTNATESPTEEEQKAARWNIWVPVSLVMVLALGFVLAALRNHHVGETSAHASPAGDEAAAMAVVAAVSFPCSSCGRILKVNQALAGKKVKCRECGNVVRVPGIEPGSVAAKTTGGRWSVLKNRRVLATALALGGVAGVCLLLFWPRREASFLNVPLGNQSVSGVEESGFHFQEYNKHGDPFRWTDGKARLVIPIDLRKPPTELVVKLEIYRPLRVKTVMVQIVVNNREVFNKQVALSKWGDSAAGRCPPGPIDLTGIDLGNELVLDIISDTFNPRSAANTDERTLGVVVQSVELLDSPR